MNAYVAWLFELSVRPGKADDLEALMQEMASATKANEPQTLMYEWNYSSNGQTLHLYERYADSAAAIIHAATFANRFAARFFAVLDPRRMCVYGTPSDELLKMIGSPVMEIYGEKGGFHR